MNEIYNRDLVDKDRILNKKKSWRYCLALLFGMFLSVASFGQTTIINPTTDGAFEEASFAADGWTVLNNTTAGGSWVQSTGATAGFTGTKCAYISSNVAGSPPPHSYTISGTRVSALYRDVTVPAGESTISLSFKWICVGESGYDRLQVWAVPTSFTPLNGTASITTTGTAPTGRVQLGAGVTGYQSSGSWTTANIVVPAAYAGTTFRLVFQWRNDSSGGSNPPIAVDDVSLISSCTGAVAIAANTITSTTATANWNAFVGATSYDLRYRVVGSGSWTTLSSLAGTSASLNSLSSASNYEYQVKANGAVCNTFSNSINFTTQCDAVTTFSQNWDGVTATALPICFNKVGTLGTVNTQASNASSGTNTLYMYATSTSAEPTLALQPVSNAGAGTHWLKFKLRASNTVGGKLQVGYLTNIADATSFVMLQEFTASSLTYTEFTCSPGTVPGTNSTLALRAKGAPANSMLIDDLVWEAIPSCLSPTALVASAVTANTATLSWTASTSSPSNGYDIYYSTTNTAPLAGTTPTVNNLASSPLNVSGLMASTTYYWWVRSDCGGDASTWATGGSFTTLCDALIAPTAVQDFETFNGVAPSPICWSEATGTLALSTTLSGTTSVWTLNTSGFANASAANKGFSINLYSTKNEWMISPAIDLGSTAGLYRVKYRYAVTSYNGTASVSTLDTHKVDVVISTDGGATWSNANSLKTYTGAATYSNTGAFETINLTAYSGVVKIAFVASTTSTSPDIDFHVDDFSVESIPNCLEPTALTVSNVGFNVADLSWISAGMSFDLEWGTQGFTQGAGTTVNLASNSYTLSGLSAGTNYSFYVRNLCGGSNSTWVGPFSFTTLTKASVTWTEGFATTALPSGFVNSGFTIGTTAALSTGTTTSYMYKNLWSSGTSANFETIYVGNLGSNDRLKFKYRLADYDAPNTAPAAESGTFKVEIKQFPSTDWIVLETVSNNAVEGWQEVSYNLAAYAGQIVKVRVTGTWISGDYYLGVDNLVIEPTPCPEWTGAVSTAWNVAGNWCDNTVPSALTNVLINSANPAIISAEVTIASLTLGATANVTVNGTLNVGNISVTTGGMMTVANNAVVLQTPTAVNTGMVTVKRNSADLFRQDYTLWSSPVSGQNLRAFSTQTLFNRFSSYDASIGTNGNYVQEIVTAADMNTKTFGTAKGYLIRMPNNWVQVGGSNVALPYLGSFTGTLNNGEIGIALSGANNKLNLVGNPYPSPISISAFFASNSSIEQTLYFWRKKGSELSAASGYATYNSLGFTSADNEINGAIPADIQTGQGFFVVANSSSPFDLVFNNGMRTSYETTFYRETNNPTNELHRFWLNLSDATNVVGQTLIGYKTGATQGVDAGVDAMYFNDSSTALTSLINDAEYIIQGRNVPFVNSDIVPLGFKTDVAGNFTISLSNFDGLFAENQDIFLKDNVTGIVHDLKLSDYTFATPVGVYNTRFEVQYTNSTLGTDNPISADHAILIGVKDQKIQINAGSVVMEKIELIDVSGRVIYTQEGVNATTATLENVVSSNQMLIVRISTKENGVVNQKIIF